MGTTSPNRGLSVPTNAGDNGTWGTELIAQAAAIDSILGGTVTLQSSAATNVTLTSSQAQCAQVTIAGAATAFQLNLPSSNFARGKYVVTNGLPGPVTVTAGSSGTGGTNVSIPATTQRTIFADGTNISFADTPFPLQAGIAFGIDGSSSPPTAGRKPGISLPFSFTVQSWRIDCADSNAASISLNFEDNYAGISGASSLGFAANINGTGTSSGWGTTAFSSGSFLSVNVNSASVGTKFTATLLGYRTT